MSRFGLAIRGVLIAAALWVPAAHAQRVELRPFLSGLNQPLYLTSAGDGTKRIFVVEKTGLVRLVKNGALSERPFLDMTAKISSGGEQGLLGIAFSPDYRRDGRLIVSYTDKRGKPTVSVFTVSKSDPDALDPESEQILLSLAHPYANHNGGNVQFGPDGMLYVGTGDGGSGGDPYGNGQNLGVLLGKMLRIDVRDGGKYKIPADNPFTSTAGARGEIWAYGLRNPWRYSFDFKTGRLFVADVGQNAFEEVDIVEKGKNYGWNTMEASHCFKPADGCKREGLELPIAEYGRGEGVSVTGGYVYRGKSVPALDGKYVFADFGSGNVWTLTEQPDKSWKRELLVKKPFAVSSFGEDEDRELYVTDFGGGVYRFESSDR